MKLSNLPRWALKQLFIASKRFALKQKGFSLFANNCIAGLILHRLGCRFNAPTVNLFFDDLSAYCRYITNLKAYTGSELVEDKTLSIQKGYPVGLLKNTLGDITLFFMHYKSFSVAKDCWERREARIVWDNIFVIVHSMYGCYEHPTLWEDFEKIPYKKALILSPAALANLPPPRYIKTI